MTKAFPMRALYCLLLICSLLPLSGCADLNISNPFETKSSDGSEVYFDQFPDVPIPRDMSVDAKRSLISVAQDGTKTGLITVEGRVDKPSLANAMILNMNRQGWNLRGAAIGSKTMHLYEKGDSYFSGWLWLFLHNRGLHRGSNPHLCSLLHSIWQCTCVLLL